DWYFRSREPEYWGFGRVGRYSPRRTPGMGEEDSGARGLTRGAASPMIATSHPKMPVHRPSGGTMSKCIDRSFALLALVLCMPAFADVPVPAPGASPRIDA